MRKWWSLFFLQVAECYKNMLLITIYLHQYSYMNLYIMKDDDEQSTFSSNDFIHVGKSQYLSKILLCRG